MRTNDNGPQLGALITDGDCGRDAIHVAIASVVAAQQLRPGQHVGLLPGSRDLVGTNPTHIGIVDPFLTQLVEPGQRFWLVLYPGSITGLRHIWKHPAFTAQSATQAALL